MAASLHLTQQCPAAQCTGGLLDSADDLRVLWLTLRTDGHATVAESMLRRDSVAPLSAPLVSAVDADLRRGAPLLYVPTLRVPWAAELKAQVQQHVGARIVSVSDPRCAPRATDILDVLSRPCYGARWRELVRSFYAPLRREYAAYNDAVVHALKAHGALPRIANLVRLAYLNRLLGALRRRARSFRIDLDRVRAAHDAPSPRMDSYSARPHSPTTPLGANTAASSSAQTSFVLRTPPPSLSLPAPPPPPPPHAVRLRRFCLVHAVPVPDAKRSPSAPAHDYIVGGICVPAYLLNAVEASLTRDYRLYIQVKEGAHARYVHHPIVGSLASLALHGAAVLDLPPVCNVISPLLEPHLPGVSVAPPPSVASSATTTASSSASQTPPPALLRTPAPPPPLRLGAPAATTSLLGASAPSPRHLLEHRSVDNYLRTCFGIGWTSVCNAAIRNARRQLRERELVHLCGAMARVEDALASGDDLRRQLVDKAVAEDMATSGLAGSCAISLARKLSDEEMADLEHRVPASVMRKVTMARERLSLLCEDK